MNGWNSEQVHALCPSQALGTLTNSKDGRVNVERPDVASIIREMVKSDNVDPNASKTLEDAIREANCRPAAQRLPYRKPTFGLAAGWVSEVAPLGVLDGMIKHADTYLNPSWSKGGPHYPRLDNADDSDGKWRWMDPVTGNSAIGYARLNVPDGQKVMWENAWTPEQVIKSVAVENVRFEEDVDFLRSKWATATDNGFTGLVLTMRTWGGQTSTIHPKVVGLPAGRYDVFVDGSLTQTRTQKDSEELQLDIQIDGDEKDLLVLQR